MKKIVPIPSESLKRLKKDDVKAFGYQFVSVKLYAGRCERGLPHPDKGIS